MSAGHRRGRVRLFDLRWILAVLFGFYGLVLTVVGVGFTDREDIEKAAGTNINLWAGVVMVAAAAVFAGWARLRPLPPPDRDTEQDRPSAD